MTAPVPPPGPAPAKKGNGLITLLVDFGPLLLFFLTYKFIGDGGIAAMIRATLVFMGAIMVAIAVGHFVLGRVSPMLWLSAVLILFFGGITIYLHDPKFIQMKPTIIYVLLGGALLIGLARGKALLRWLFGPIFPGLSEEGWRKLSRNWAVFFLALAIANELLRLTLSFDAWLTVKVWGFTLVSLLFAFANLPMLIRHGLDPEGKAEAVEKTPLE